MVRDGLGVPVLGQDAEPRPVPERLGEGAGERPGPRPDPARAAAAWSGTGTKCRRVALGSERMQGDGQLVA